MRWRVGVVVAVVLVVTTACVVPMSDLGGAWSRASAINDAGVVVGTAARPDGVAHAFKRLPDGTVVDLGALPGSTSSNAVAINDHGVVVGTSFLPGGPRAVSWTADGEIHDLCAGNAKAVTDDGLILVDCAPEGLLDPSSGVVVSMPLLPGSSATEYAGVNDHGQVVGWQFADRGGGLVDVPVRWDVATGEVVDLSTLSGPSFLPVAINDRGTMVGFAESAGFPDEAAVVLAGSGEVIRLGVGGEWSVAHALNESDTVIGYDGENVSFRWRPGNGLERLGDESAFAYALNDAGTVVGTSNDRAAFISFPTP